MYQGWHLKLQAHLPACGPINLNDSPEITAEKYPLRIDQGILAKPRWVDLACLSVKHGGKRINGNLTFNGELSYLATELPTGEPAILFWTDRANTLVGAVCGKPVEIEVLPACLICGDEEHRDKECLYLPLLNGRPIHTKTPENDIMESRPRHKPSRRIQPWQRIALGGKPAPPGGKKASGVRNGH
ncbi:hypothetical protein PtB15_11B314 [Puccinia triticina]|nr:hypothetical protein PtB15_11B314 [Puccinia triticina]